MPAATTAAQNLLIPSLADGAPKPVFTGEQRVKALSVLAQSIFEHKVMAVLQLVNKDPSLAFETLEMPAAVLSNATQRVEFPLACLQRGLTPGYLFAISRGFPVDQLLQNETVTLLQAAMHAHGSASRDSSADVSLLLGLGAQPNAMVSKVALYEALVGAYPRGTDAHSPGVVNMLIDAKCDFGYPDDIDSPFNVLVATGGWKDAATTVEITKTMARLVKAGIDPGKRTGTPRKSPLETAIGLSNGGAIVALIRIGAPTGPEALKGRDLLEVMRSYSKLQEFLPLVQAALMESHISKCERESASTAASSPAESTPPRDIRRQRIGV